VEHFFLGGSAPIQIVIIFLNQLVKENSLHSTIAFAEGMKRIEIRVVLGKAFNPKRMYFFFREPLIKSSDAASWSFWRLSNPIFPHLS
jgi:hypothetical protein